MHSALLLLPALGAAFVAAQGKGLGNPPPPPMTLTSAMSGVLPVIPTATPFAGVETEEGAIVYDGPANPSFMPVNGPASTAVNPAATYIAMLPSTNFDDGTGSTIMGSIVITSSQNQPGVVVTANFTGFPSESEYGPFVYHIHTLPVPANGNCSATMGHLDPTDRGEYYPCVPGAPATCQVGDLAGKHGNITGSSFTATYSDAFLSTTPGNPAFFGDKSIVIHTANTTRLTCANFMLVTGTNSTGTGMAPKASSAGNGSSAAMPASTVQSFTGSAAKASGFGAMGVLAVAAAAFLL